ncbi:unnamed protein product, partial [Trichogramma brassicae]
MMNFAKSTALPRDRSCVRVQVKFMKAYGKSSCIRADIYSLRSKTFLKPSSKTASKRSKQEDSRSGHRKNTKMKCSGSTVNQLRTDFNLHRLMCLTNERRLSRAKFNVRLAVNEFIGTLTKFHAARCTLCFEQFAWCSLSQVELLHKCVRRAQPHWSTLSASRWSAAIAPETINTPICRVARGQKYYFSLYVIKLKSEYLLFHGEENKTCTRSRYSSRESIVARLQQTRKQLSRFLNSKPSISKSQKNLNVNPSLNLMLQVSRPNLTAFYDICPRNFGKKEKDWSWPCTYRRRESRSYTGAQSREKVNSAASLASRHGAKSHS